MMNESYMIRLNIEREGCPVIDIFLSVGTAEELSRAKKQIEDTMALFVQLPGGAAGEDAGQESERVEASPGRLKSFQEMRGSVQLRCPACGSVFGKFLHDKTKSCVCRCGHSIDLTGPLARYSFTCPSCGKYSYGKTNLEDAEITVRCVCDENLTLRWNPETKEYQN